MGNESINDASMQLVIETHLNKTAFSESLHDARKEKTN